MRNVNIFEGMRANVEEVVLVTCDQVCEVINKQVYYGRELKCDRLGEI